MTRTRFKGQPRRVRRLDAQGLWDAEIARRLGLSISYVGRLRGRLGLSRVPPPKGFRRSFDENVARRLHGQGLKDWEIARGVGVSRETIQKWRTRLGLPPTGGGAVPKSGSSRPGRAEPELLHRLP